MVSFVRFVTMPRLILLSLMASAVVPLFALRAQAPSVPVGCTHTLDSLDARLRRNYAGFQLEVVTTRRSGYERALATARADASIAGTDATACTAALRRYIAFFSDPHLFLFQNTAVDTAGNRRRRESLRRDQRDEAALRAEWSAPTSARDPLEGIWRDGALRVAVVRERPRSDTLIAIVLASDTSIWPVGGVRARFVREGDGRYGAQLLTRHFGEQQLTATLHRRNILRFSPGMWGREYPVPDREADVAPAPDPRRPRLAVREQSVVIAIPSHDGPYQRVIDSLVAVHRDALMRTRLIIVDVRGNEGGGSLTTRALHPFIVSAERRPTPFDSGTAMILSSPEQQDYVRRISGTSPSPAATRLLARMDSNPGRLVPFSDEAPSAAFSPTPIDGPFKVAILTDGGTVSAAEVTVLMGLRSTRATVVGEPTAGALDYQSTSIIGLGTGDRRWALGYPTITAHADLPARGMRGKGIAPQVPIAWKDVDDAYAAVERLMLNERRR